MNKFIVLVPDSKLFAFNQFIKEAGISINDETLPFIEVKMKILENEAKIERAKREKAEMLLELEKSNARLAEMYQELGRLKK